MTETPDRSACAAADASHELAQVQGQVEAARAVLIRLLQEVVEAEARLSSRTAAELVEANEQLVVSALRAQTDAVAAAFALDDAAQLAQHDALTQLPNRLLLLDRLAHAIAGARRHRTRLALMFLDLDNFKQINDTFGHGEGDRVLKRVAQCLAASVRAADTVSRHGGDEFLVLLTEVSQPSDAALIAAKLIAAIGALGEVGDPEQSLSASIGISVYPDDGEDAATLIERADAAMYRAKRHGPGSLAFHGQEPTGERSGEPPPIASPEPGTSAGASPLAEHERRHAQLREANEQLVLAALDARDLQAAAEEAQRRQTAFMTVVANELSNPLAPIRIATAMLGRVRTDEPLLPKAQALIEGQLANLARLLDARLAGSHTGSGTLELERRAIDIGELIRKAVDAWRAAMQARRQRIAVHLPAGAIPFHGDPARLAQVFGNLLDNASKFTPVGGEIDLSLELAGDSVVTTVSDNGIGISAAALPHVFEPFAQDARAIGFGRTGPGLGLTVVREVVQAHGGSVVARSAGSGLGSQFVVTLPRA